MIDKLTPEQEKQLAVYRDKWIALGFNTTQVDEKEVNRIISDIYTVIFEKEVPEIKVFSNPMVLWQYVQKVIGQKVDFVWPYFAGHLDVNIFAYYDYCIDVLGVKVDEAILKKYNVWKEIHKIGLIYPFDDVCLVSQKPIEYHHNTAHQLHCETGPALRYADGLDIYLLNGVRMPKEYVMTPWDKLEANLITKEQNAEVRRELVRKIGIERVVSKLGAKIVDTQGDYELLLLNIGDNTFRPYLKMKNPSIGTYHIEGVPPGTKTVKEALVFRNGTDETPTVLT